MDLPALITLAAGDLSVQLCPETGGSIARFRHGDVDLFRPASDADIALRDPRHLGSYPLFPYSNRVREGRFTFDGRSYRLALNFGDHPHSIHGNAWQRPWQVEAQAGAAARLGLAHDPARDGVHAWPFAYTATLSFALAPDGLEVRLSLRNDDARPMPAGFGLHPYFPRTPEVQLTAPLAGMWLAGPTLLSTEHVMLPPALDFTRGRRIAEVECDNCFTGWPGEAAIDWPERRLRLALEASQEFGQLVIFVPRGRDFFAVEPVSHVNDALNLAARGRADTGLVVLAPGATLAGKVRFRVTKI